jgi:hypothetical protein
MRMTVKTKSGHTYTADTNLSGDPTSVAAEYMGRIQVAKDPRVLQLGPVLLMWEHVEAIIFGEGWSG